LLGRWNFCVLTVPHIACIAIDAGRHGKQAICYYQAYELALRITGRKDHLKDWEPKTHQRSIKNMESRGETSSLSGSNLQLIAGKQRKRWMYKSSLVR
jgi:hypothetical protein